MSYCVNCGVELDKTAKKCPLCRTEVLNPNYPVDSSSPTPYPTEKGMVDPVSRKGLSIFLSVVLTAIALACLLLNIFLFKESFWSAYVMGACLLVWIYTVPVMLLKPHILLTILLDGAALAFYCFVIALQSEGRDWYYQLALPIIAVITFLVLQYCYIIRRFKMSIISRTAYLIGEIGVLNISIELAIRHMAEGRFYIRWSAVVITCCAIVVIALITVAQQSQLRESFRRRMHI